MIDTKLDKLKSKCFLILNMKIIVVGNKVFTTCFMLSGVIGNEVNNSNDALNKIKKIIKDDNIGLILISEDISKNIKEELTEIRNKNTIPLIYEIPPPGSKVEKVEYRDLIKQLLKM